MGGFVFGALLLAVARRVVAARRAVALRALLGMAVVALGIAGDLFESMLKRSAGVKDSSALIPGHGGILDRIDALLFAAPVYYVVLKYMSDRHEADRHPRINRLDRPERARGRDAFPTPRSGRTLAGKTSTGWSIRFSDIGRALPRSRLMTP